MRQLIPRYLRDVCILVGRRAPHQDRSRCGLRHQHWQQPSQPTGCQLQYRSVQAANQSSCDFMQHSEHAFVAVVGGSSSACSRQQEAPPHPDAGGVVCGPSVWLRLIMQAACLIQITCWQQCLHAWRNLLVGCACRPAVVMVDVVDRLIQAGSSCCLCICAEAALAAGRGSSHKVHLM